jgi:hypothetical protein
MCKLPVKCRILGGSDEQLPDWSNKTRKKSTLKRDSVKKIEFKTKPVKVKQILVGTGVILC